MLGQRIEQNDFSGGVNLQVDPIQLTNTELSDVQNLSLVQKNKLQTRKGYVEFNSTANTLGANVEVRSASQFKNCKGTLHPVVQASDDVVYVGSAAFGSTGTWAAIKTQTASSKPAVFCEVDKKLIMTNGVDLPQVYEGTYGRCEAFLVTHDDALTIYDYTTEVSDEDASTYAVLDSLNTAAQLDWFYIGVRVPTVKGIRLEIKTANTTAATLAGDYWNGNTWTPLTISSDGTFTATETLAVSGDVAFTEITMAPRLVEDYFFYFLRFAVSAQLSSSVRISAAYVKYGMQTLQPIWDGTTVHTVDMRKTVNSGAAYTNYTTEVSDASTATGAALGALDTIANGDWFHISYTSKFLGIKVTMGTDVNTNAATLTAKYYNGNAWAAVTIFDGTAVSGKTLAQSGYIWLAIPTAWEISDEALTHTPTFQLQFGVSAALSATVDVNEIDLVPQPDSLLVSDLCENFKDRLVLVPTKAEYNVLQISAELKPHDFSSTDFTTIDVPVNQKLTAIKTFYNELFISTINEVFLLEGYSPSTFGLLRIQTGGVGSVNQHGVILYLKYLFFPHSSDFFVFDGTQVLNVSMKIAPFFDPVQTTYYIPPSRFEDIQGRFVGETQSLEWTVSMGSSQTTNNRILTLFPGEESKPWFIHNIVAASLWAGPSTNGQEVYIHGDYTGKVHTDYTTTTDNGVAITSYITTGSFSSEQKEVLLVCRGLQTIFDAESSGSITVTVGVSGTTTLSSYGTLSLIESGSSYARPKIYDPLYGRGFKFKLSSAVPYGLYSITAFISPVRITNL